MNMQLYQEMKSKLDPLFLATITDNVEEAKDELYLKNKYSVDDVKHFLIELIKIQLTEN